MPCIFHAFGRRFEVDTFCASTSLAPYQIYHKGDVKHPKSKLLRRTLPASGFKVDVSSAGFEQLPRQVRHAIVFLGKNKRELRRLSRCPGVEKLYLDFGINGRHVAVQCDYLPPDLLQWAGDLGIGIELSRYST